MKPFLRLCCFLFVCSSLATAADQPNILWITSEDNGPQLGCYGDQYADTPNLDALAEKSLRYKMCWSNAPVCAPARTTLISGMYATSLGGHHMRSGVKLPENIKMYPEVLKAAGYYCTNKTKKDYNFAGEDGGWDDSSSKSHWRNRPSKDTPFFSVFNFTVSHESKIRSTPHTLKHDPAKARVPAYQPDVPEVRRDWAQYYDKMTEMDTQVGGLLEQLEKDGLVDSTIIFYYGDHGSGMPRSKRWPFNSGLQVPLLLHVPAKFKDLAPADYKAGGISDRLTAFVDMGPTAISLAGVKPPQNMQGVPFAGKFNGESKKYLFGYRGRMDERVDMVRSVTDGRYVYMRHFYPDRPYLKHVEYMFSTTTTRVWKEMFDAGKLNDVQAKVWQDKPVQELFDLQSDPDETVNLATDPVHVHRVNEMRTALMRWMIDTQDIGLLPEDEMHRRSGELSPREFAASGKLDFDKAVPFAMSAMDKSLASETDLIAALSDEDSCMRFWAARGLSIRAGKNAEIDNALVKATADSSSNVAIAACDGLLLSENAAHRKTAKARLVELANVDTVGHFAAVNALNVLDMNVQLDETTTDALKQLPRQAKKPPVRLGKYVGKLLNHALKIQAPAKQKKRAKK